jgi:hypothetical protein
MKRNSKSETRNPKQSQNPKNEDINHGGTEDTEKSFFFLCVLCDSVVRIFD